MSVQETVRENIRSAIKALFNLDIREPVLEVPPRTALGDLASPVAFEVAKQVKAKTGQKLPPREIASKISAQIGHIPGVARVEVAGAGYINIFLNRAEFLVAAMKGPGPVEPQLGGKIIVEHTAVNPNKAAHIGHVRNAVLGDTIIRMLRHSGDQVEAQSYIDNTGVQVADVVVGFRHLEGKNLAQVAAIGGKFDYYCWDLYARVGAFYEEDRSRLRLRSDTLHAIESGKGEIAELAEHIAARITECHLDTMYRLGIEYDLLPRESEVLHLHFWDAAFDLLKRRGAVVHEENGRLAGCWVMKAEPDQAEPGSPVSDAESEPESEHEADKVIVRSNGTVTYTGKDIAFHLWKLGQLDLDFYYRPCRIYSDGHVVWITTEDGTRSHSDHPTFGNGDAYFNVIDIGQSYPQHYVKLGVMAVDHGERIKRSAHLAYERVVLSPAAAEQLGQHLSEQDRTRGTVAMAGRKGLGVKADDLIDQLEAGALAEVASRHPGLTEIQKRDTAHKIAAAALRYFLLKYSRTSIISFDFAEALALTGETGPYLQYSVVRANSIFKNIAEAGIQTDAGAIAEIPSQTLTELFGGDDGEELWALLYSSMRLNDTVRGAISALEPAVVAKWAFQLAQSFNTFYHNHSVKHEKDPSRKALLVAITFVVRRQLVLALDILGIEAPEQM